MKKLQEPFKIAIIYGLVGVIWILFSDRFLLLFLDQKDLKELTYFQTIKGFLYVVITALLLFFLVRRYYNSLTSRLLNLENLNKILEKQKADQEKYSHELEESEKRFSDLFNICPLPLWVFDYETFKFLDVNAAAIRHYGFDKEEFLEMTIMDIRPSEEIDRVKKMIDVILSGQKSVYKGIFRHHKKNGEILSVKIKSNVIEYRGTKAGLVVAHDITELLKAQQDLKDAYDSIVQIEDAERARFAAELHDSLGQNLIAIKHFIAILSGDEISESKKSMHDMLLEVVDNSIKECKQIIHNLRPKELYDAGLRDVVQSTCDRINFSGTLKIRCDLGEDIDDGIQINTKFHLFRILQENLNNTMKHAEASEAIIEITKKNKKIHFFFSDNGKGIDPKALHAESSFLSLKRRVISLGGTHDIQSDLGKGMVFYCKIPIGESQSE